MSDELQAYIDWLNRLKTKDPDKFVQSVARLIKGRDARIKKLAGS